MSLIHSIIYPFCLLGIPVARQYTARHAARASIYSPLVMNRFLSHLHFKILNEKQRELRPKEFYLQLYNKDECIWEWDTN